LEELNILERIDLAPSEVVALTAKEREPAEWALASSRELRHAITDIQDAEAMERAASQASQVSEEFMQRYWKLAAECPKCKSVREKAKRFVEKARGKAEEG
jgi:Mn-dependent DtxR family transcriptional regulator